VRLSRRYRYRQLTRLQRIVGVEAQNAQVVQDAIAAKQGVMITPNHSVHYDAPALYLAADTIDQPLFFMTAWQVFAMSSRFEGWAMQRLGCFSVDREGNDRQAFKQAVRMLHDEPYPLVIFPEGDIYHTTDYVTHFREGAAAMALAATKRSSRPIVTIPCGIKFWYVDDPVGELERAMQRLEERLHLRVNASRDLVDRIHRMAEAALALKELDYLGCTRSGRLRERVGYLAESVLEKLEERHGLAYRAGTVPARVKLVRQRVIDQLDDADGERDANQPDTSELAGQMDDLFFVMQLYSYPGDYLADHPTIERLAETIDKFEEDVLGLEYPSVKGRRRAVVRFGEPIQVSRGRGQNDVAELTNRLQTSVQGLVDELNAQSSTGVTFDRIVAAV
jgi:hypothetical protein